MEDAGQELNFKVNSDGYIISRETTLSDNEEKDQIDYIGLIRLFKDPRTTSLWSQDHKKEKENIESKENSVLTNPHLLSLVTSLRDLTQHMRVLATVMREYGDKEDVPSTTIDL